MSRFVTPVCLAVTLVAVAAAAACGREQGPEAASIGTVVGAVIEVEATSIVETKMLRVRDGSGWVWTFDALDYRGFTPSHLRAHMLQELGVLECMSHSAVLGNKLTIVTELPRGGRWIGVIRCAARA